MSFLGNSDDECDADFYEGFKNDWPFGTHGSAKDVIAPTGKACRLISKILAQAGDNAGEFTFGGQAEPLPISPGLEVKGVGPIPLPLIGDVAEKLIAASTKSPYGRQCETLMDDNIRKSWELPPSQIQLTNPLWRTGLGELAKTIAVRLGYCNVPLQIKLYKLLVYAEGGHFAKHRDTEKENGMIATLVVQPPSLHEGGDLLVNRDTATQYRHDFGKSDGTAAYLPHYAVHYADAEHTLETVTKGYRLVLVCSICVPPSVGCVRNDETRRLSGELATAINNMEEGDDAFALLLSHQYTPKSIGDLGVQALKGVDRARYFALKEANDSVDSAKKLHLFLAELSSTLEFIASGDEWEPLTSTGSMFGPSHPGNKNDSITWYSETGKSFGCVEDASVELNLLNPQQETLSRMWRPYGSTTLEGSLGNDGITRDTKYSRYAIVGLSELRGAERVLEILNEHAALDFFHRQKAATTSALSAFSETASKLIDDDATTKILEYQKPVDAEVLGSFMSAVNAELSRTDRHYRKTPVSIAFCCDLAELVVDAGSPQLVKQLFSDIGIRMTLRDCTDNALTTWVMLLISIASSLDWDAIKQEFPKALLAIPNSTGISVLVVECLGSGTAHDDILKSVLGRITMRDYSKEQLWKGALRSDDKTVLDDVVSKFKQADPSELQPVVEGFLPLLAHIDKEDDKFVKLKVIVDMRIKWLNHQTRTLDKPFSWEMPDAKFSDSRAVETFLRGPQTSTVATGLREFENLQDAKNYAAKRTRNQQTNVSFEMEAGGDDENAFVTITKTRQCFSARQEMLKKHKAELQILVAL